LLLFICLFVCFFVFVCLHSVSYSQCCLSHWVVYDWSRLRYSLIFSNIY
jgi:hypothetical protein